MMKPIGIIAGDPNSINSEIIGKMWKQKSTFKNINIFVIGNFNLLKKQLKALKININIKKINTIKNQNFKKKLLILDVPLSFKKPFNVQNKVKVKYILNSFDMAIKMSLEKKILGFINCPINKKEVFKNKNYGITEFLGKKLGVLGKEVMLIYNKKLAIAPITTHIKLRKVSRALSKQKIKEKIKIINNFYIKKLKIKPKIGILGLNPHNDEMRKNSEEKTFIIPAINELKLKGLNVNGPLSPDTAFLNYQRYGYNVLIGMYHDQVLSPFKALFKFNAINITLGIPLLRVSPDHGTGTDIIRKNLANPESLISSINFFKNKNVKT